MVQSCFSATSNHFGSTFCHAVYSPLDFFSLLGTPDDTLFPNAIKVAGAVSIATIFFLVVLYFWSHCHTYDWFCDWFYDESRKWSYASLATALILGIATLSINNSLLLTSLTSINQPSNNFFLPMYYPTAMWIAGHILFNLLILLFYFKIDRSEEITKKITFVDGLLILFFSLTPMATATAIHFQPWTNWILLLGSIITTLSAFFIWVRISHLHLPLDAEGKVSRKRLRKQIPKQWRMHRQLQRWRWDRRFPQRRESNVGMFR